MKVRKKDGRIEDFDMDKLITTVENASDDVKEPMNLSDVENVVQEVEKRLIDEKIEVLDSDFIKDVVVEKLIEFGFKDVAKAYQEFKL
ncbi:Transcriptional repressor NrdR [Caloramator mitchellensis]|uniref:Transcriptional repressor NrdR n=1 Tax=Caloramator mitchellensis TaxID=908809 RepID=A0A0R3JTP7_CALMK|nr:ATP cone domain-containing protein [Caloramator mitchellensis]KRQ86891.1 Transcriptional repressor NrdR [Caloramator mitchellensis]